MLTHIQLNGMTIFVKSSPRELKVSKVYYLNMHMYFICNTSSYTNHEVISKIGRKSISPPSDIFVIVSWGSKLSQDDLN